MRNGLSPQAEKFAIIRLSAGGRTLSMMEPSLDIPKRAKRKSPLPLILMMGVAVISFIIAANAVVAMAVFLAVNTAPLIG